MGHIQLEWSRWGFCWISRWGLAARMKWSDESDEIKGMGAVIQHQWSDGWRHTKQVEIPVHVHNLVVVRRLLVAWELHDPPGGCQELREVCAACLWGLLHKLPAPVLDEKKTQGVHRGNNWNWMPKIESSLDVMYFLPSGSQNRLDIFCLFQWSTKTCRFIPPRNLSSESSPTASLGGGGGRYPLAYVLSIFQNWLNYTNTFWTMFLWSRKRKALEVKKKNAWP